MRNSEVGMPAVFGRDVDIDKEYEKLVYGRISKLHGLRIDGCNPIISITTPGGSVIKTGVSHVPFLGDEVAGKFLERLHYFEDYELERDEEPYTANDPDYSVPNWKEFRDRESV